MGLYTIRPTATHGTKNVTLNGGTANAITSDDSASTWIQYFTGGTVASPSFVLLGLADPAIPTNEAIQQVRVRVQYKTLNGNTDMHVIQENSAGQQSTSDYWTTNKPTLSIDTAGWRVTAPDGGTWTLAKVNDLRVRIQDNDNGTTKPQVYEVYVDVQTTVAPVVTMSAPSGTLTETSTPQVVGTYSDTEGDPQDAYQVRVFTQAQYSIVAFDPATSPATEETGVVAGSNGVVWTPTIPQANGTYRAYSRVRNNSVPGGHWSDWSYAQYTVSVLPPSPPAFSAIADSANARVSLGLRAADNLLDADTADLENGLGTWQNLSNATVARSTAVTPASGAYSLSLTCTGTTGGRMEAVAGGTGTAAAPVTSFAYYEASARFRAGTTARTCRMYIYWYKADGSASATASTQLVGTTDSTTGWSLCQQLVQVPIDAAFARVSVAVVSPIVGEVHYVDQIGLMPSSTVVYNRGPITGTTRTYEIQRSLDNGTTWEDIARVLPSTSYSDPTERTLYDWEAPRGLALKYRARVKWVTPSGAVFVSSWVQSSGSTTVATTGWKLKSLTDPGSYTVDLVVGADSFTEDEPIDTGYFEPIDADGTITVFGRSRGKRLSMDLRFQDPTQFDRFTALRRRREVCLLQDSNGRQWYVTLPDKRPASERRWPSKVLERQMSAEFVEAVP